MKRPAQDQAPVGAQDSKRLLTHWATSDELNDTEADTLQSIADSSTSTVQPTQTGAATSITSSSPGSRANRRFPSDLKTIKCTIPGCPKTFNRPARLAAHLRSHSNDRPHKCPYPECDKDYIEEKHLTQHIKGSHTHEKKYTCTEPGCGKSFVTATRLRRHAAVHEGAERFRCRGYEGCNETFRKHQTLQRHIRTAHLGQPAYVCGNDGCDSGFDTASALKRHVNREHGELKFWCDECANNKNNDDDEPRRVGFTTLLLLQNHMKREHLNCMFCDAKCGTRFDLEHHIDIHHSGTTVEERKTVACTWEGCNKKFTRVSNLNTHIKTAHEGKRFVCGQVNTFDVPDIADWNWEEEGCGKDFVSKLKLEEHVRFVHLGRERPPKMFTAATAAFANSMVDEALPIGLPRDIACTFEGCNAKFARYWDLDRHLKNEHITEPTMDDLALAAALGEELSQVQEEEKEGGVDVHPVQQETPVVCEEVPFAIDPLLEQQSEGLILTTGTDNGPPYGNEEFWFTQEEYTNLSLQQSAQIFD